MNSNPSPPAPAGFQPAAGTSAGSADPLRPTPGRGEQTLAGRDWLAATAAAKPDGLALRAGGRDWIYAELDAEVDGMAAALMAHGIGAGGHVGVLMPNRADYVLLIHALARIGAVLVALNTRLTASEVAWQVAAADCTAVVCDESTAAVAREAAGSAAVVAVEALTPNPSSSGRGEDETELAVGAVTSPPNPLSSRRGGVDDTLPSTRSRNDEAALGARPLTLPTALTPSPSPSGRGVGDAVELEAVQAILFTSGTTGRPKGARLTFGNHWHSALASAWRSGVLPDDRWLVCLPLYHAGGLAIVWRSCIYGTALVLETGFSVERVQAAFDRDTITLVSLVPTQLYRLMQAETRWPESLRLILLGGAAATPDLMAQATTLNLPVATSYGLTESASQVATLPPEAARRKPGSVGKALTGTDIWIVGSDGQWLAAGEIGEVVVRGPTVMRGYYKQPDSATLRDGTLYTGDLGYMDADGDLWIVQRRSDLIVSGGENVYPAEVEAVLRQHPAVADACVVGLANAEWGQSVAAAVVLKPGAAVDESALSAFCRETLAGYKRPRRFKFVDALPQTASGKVMRPAVAALFEPTAPAPDTGL